MRRHSDISFKYHIDREIVDHAERNIDVATGT